MNGIARRTALSALDAARPAIARLDQSRHLEEQAADLIESWNAIETALRSLVGGTALSGQALIREARQRQMLTFEQANALAEFSAAADRAHTTQYEPTPSDLESARDAFLKLEAGLMAPEPGPAPPPTLDTSGMRASPLGPPEAVPPPREGYAPWVKGLLALVIVVIVGGLLYGGYSAGWFGGNRSTALDRGVAYYQRGQREAAVGEFTKAIRDDPNDPLPHVYLSRMAREVGNLTVASEEAQTAVRLGPNNHLALRELGLFFLSANNLDLARRFLVRAVQADETDRMAMGYLGCTLYRLGRAPEAQTWLNRAGSGDWSRCVAPPAGATSVPGAAPTP